MIFSATIFIIALAIAAFYFFKSKQVTEKEDRYGSMVSKIEYTSMVKPISILVIGILISAIQPYKIERVDAGNVGIAVNLAGDERGIANYQYKTGWVTINTWTQQLYEFPTFQQHIEYGEQNLVLKGGFVFPISPTFNYSLVTGSIGDMFQNLRLPLKEVENGWLKTAILGAANDEANRWVADSILNHREGFEAAVIKECNKRVAKWFTISQLRTNAVPPKSLRDAIDRQMQAVKNAQAEMALADAAMSTQIRKVAQARADSAEKVITAKGNAAATIAEAQGDAEAMRLKQRELTPTYVEFVKWSNWNGVLPSTMTGQGTGILLNK
jgi:hypothetical protein